MGAGDMKKLAECILEATEEEELIVVCGNNQKTMNQLKKAFGSEKRIKILGYTTQMTLYVMFFLQSPEALLPQKELWRGSPWSTLHPFQAVKLPTGNSSEKQA